MTENDLSAKAFALKVKGMEFADWLLTLPVGAQVREVKGKNFLAYQCLDTNEVYTVLNTSEGQVHKESDNG